MENILHKVEVARINKTFTDGLTYASVGGYCHHELTDKGFRIWRDANRNGTPGSGDGLTKNWGCLVIQNNNNQFNLQKEHTYLIEFEVTGKSDSAAGNIGWSNQSGWGGGGLSPNPSNVVNNNPVKATFNTSDWETFSYKFTITDDIYKTCTSTYSGFTLGNSYISYRDFLFGWNYTQTGSLGTDIYIKNIRMFDITSGVKAEITKQGLAQYTSFVEGMGSAQISSGGCIELNEIIEI